MSAQQRHTSAGTSLNQIPALHRWYGLKRGYGGRGAPNVVDYGAGKYDAAGEYIMALGIEYFPFDPYNRTDMENVTATEAMSVLDCDVLCANVLNVIAEREHRDGVMRTAARCTGTAYFGVYEGNRSGVGQPTTKGYQNNRTLASYISELAEHFDNVERRGNFLACWN